MSRPCSDPQYCYCVNYDEHSDYLCDKEDYEVFTPDMNDCARYLNCSDGCFNSVLVRTPTKYWGKGSVINNGPGTAPLPNYLWGKRLYVNQMN